MKRWKKELCVNMKKINDEVARALMRCTEALSISEFSRQTGVRIDILSRYITKQTKNVREETWNKIFPVLKPYLTPAEAVHAAEPPPRIGEPYRRHHELVEMSSDQKVLLDVLAALPAARREQIRKDWLTRTNAPAPCKFTSLSSLENEMMAAFLSWDEKTRESELLAILPAATAEVRRRRAELF